MNDRLRVGIIGCGGIAGSHVAGYQANGSRVCALTDVNRDAAVALSETIEGDVELFESYKEMIDSGKVDAVSICTPPVAHEEAVIYALQRNCHVLCEKPLAVDQACAQRIKRVADESETVLMLAFRHRFLPAIQKVKEIIDNGGIGQPVMFRNVFGGAAFAMKDRWFCRKNIAGGGCMLDTSSHSVDLFRYLIGEVVEQHAVMHRHFEDTDVEDAAILTLKAANGTLATLGSGFVLGDGMAFIDITGQDGRVIYDYLKPTEVKYKKRGAGDWQIIEVAASNGFSEEIAHFANVIAGREELMTGIDDGVRCQEIIQSNYKNIDKKEGDE